MPFDVTRKRGPALHHGSIAIILQARLAQAGELHGLSIEPDGTPPVNTTDKVLQRRLYYHTGEALRYIMKDISSEQLRYQNSTLRGIVMLLIFVVNGSATPQWKPHLAGLMSIIMQRGGLEKVLASAQDSEMRSMFQIFLM